MFSLPDDFVRTQIELHGDAGRAWLDALPSILADCASAWNLTLEPPFPNLSYHYAAPARRVDGMPVVLKACAPTGEFAMESAALRVYDGRGAARLIEINHEREVMLLERCEPGTVLLDTAEDAHATSIAAAVMRQLWTPIPPGHPFPSVADWGQGFDRMRRHFGGGVGPFPAAIVEQATRLYCDLGNSAAPSVVLHGDLHHGNILDAGSRGWLAIDPKGLIGEPAYETGSFLRNNMPDDLGSGEAKRLLVLRIDQFADELNLDRARIRDWALAQAVLSAWWRYVDHGHGWEPAIALAELIARL